MLYKCTLEIGHILLVLFVMKHQEVLGDSIPIVYLSRPHVVDGLDNLVAEGLALLDATQPDSFDGYVHVHAPGHGSIGSPTTLYKTWPSKTAALTKVVTI